MRYCNSIYSYSRVRTHEVRIGDVALGADHPIRIQSMTTTNTLDTAATVAQVLRMVDSGCEYVRITAPSMNEAENLRVIREELHKRGCHVPLIADIHFTPNAAELAARIVEKVRVNPGNYVDKKKFQVLEYTDAEYNAEIERIHKRFSPLVKICKEYGTAMRIGTNHGSLNDRILSRFGDTPLGMVESALEFLRICEDHSYDQVVISMKASNPQVMVQAYRMLVQKMQERGKVFPLHLGVTEAGEGEDGRIKSALGISTLLLDGIGDTVRVSLTEEPEYEAPVARFLVEHAVARREQLNAALGDVRQLPDNPVDPFQFQRRETIANDIIGGGQVPAVFAGLQDRILSHADLKDQGFSYDEASDKYNFSESSDDFAFLGSRMPVISLPGSLRRVFDAEFYSSLQSSQANYPYFKSPAEYLSSSHAHPRLNFVAWSGEDIDCSAFASDPKIVWVMQQDDRNALYKWRAQMYRLMQAGSRQPFVLRTGIPSTFDFYSDDSLPEAYRLTPAAKAQLYAAAQVSSLMVDGLCDGLWIEPSGETSHRSAFGILQLAILRSTRTEYISCPSCGRTLFDLQETTAKIRMRTEHLKGVKIGIMGCIVNGPGEMADADYGYVGVGPGKIALYRGKEVVERAIKTEWAVDKLIELIRNDGRWTEPQS